MFRPGEKVAINLMVLRVEGTRLDAQTPDGQLIQTDVSNVADKSIRTVPENKAVRQTPENKSVKK
jgi:hypothetical protein